MDMYQEYVIALENQDFYMPARHIGKDETSAVSIAKV